MPGSGAAIAAGEAGEFCEGGVEVCRGHARRVAGGILEGKCRSNAAGESDVFRERFANGVSRE